MMREIKAIFRPERLSDVLRALHAMPDLPGVTISTVRGFGRRYPVEAEPTFDEVEMTKLEIVVPTAIAQAVVEIVQKSAHTGRVGDGKIFMLPVDHVIRIRSSEWDATTP